MVDIRVVVSLILLVVLIALLSLPITAAELMIRRRMGRGKPKYWLAIIDTYTSGKVQWVAGNAMGMICSGICHLQDYPEVAHLWTKDTLKEQHLDRQLDDVLGRLENRKRLDG